MPSLVDLLVESGLAKSKGEARRTVSEGGAYLNNQRVEDPEHVPGADDILAGGWLVLRRGKKNFAGVSSENAKKITKLIRDEGPKGVKAQIQGDELRVSLEEA